MNKRGDVSTIILFLVAIFFAVVSLLAMAGFKGDFGDWSKETSDIMTEVEFAEQYVLESADVIARDSINCDESVYGLEICSEEDLKERFKQIASMRDIGYFGAGNFFGEIRNGKFSFVDSGKGSYTLSFDEDLFVQAKRGRNEVRRNFNTR